MIGCRSAAELSELSIGIAIEEAECSAEVEQSLVGPEVKGRKLDQLLRDKEAQLAG